MNTIRIPENNDWVILTLLGCCFIYIFILHSLQRGASIKEFLLSKHEESSNSFISWILISLINCITLSVLLSQYIPFIPKEISQLSIGGFELNKIGYTALCISCFYLIKTSLSFLFFHSIGVFKRWNVFCFINMKYYFIISFIVLLLCIIHYYFPIDKKITFEYYVIFLALTTLFKLAYYTFHPSKILPEEWYYKILYICTLQITPLFALWKLLFY